MRRAVRAVRTYEARLSDDANGDADVREQVEAGRQALTLLRSFRDDEASKEIREHVVARLRVDPMMSVAEILEAMKHESMRRVAREQRERREWEVKLEPTRRGPKRTGRLTVESVVDGSPWRVGNRRHEANPFVGLALPFQWLRVEVLRHWHATIFKRKILFAQALAIVYYKDELLVERGKLDAPAQEGIKTSEKAHFKAAMETLTRESEQRRFRDAMRQLVKDDEISWFAALQKLLRDKSQGFHDIQKRFRRIEKNLNAIRSK